jgi:8-oxo-dGTP diphosphatase
MSERVRNRERFKLSMAVFLLMLDGDKLLLILRSDTGWFDGHYSVPGGVKEPKETLSAAVTREAAEEVGTEISPEDVLLVHTMHNFTTGQEWIGTFFITQKWAGTPQIKEPHKHGELRWVDINDLPKNVSPYVRQAIEQYLNGVSYSEFGWEVPEDADEQKYVEHFSQKKGTHAQS